MKATSPGVAFFYGLPKLVFDTGFVVKWWKKEEFCILRVGTHRRCSDMKVRRLALAVMVVAALAGCASENATSGSGAGGYYGTSGPECGAPGRNATAYSSSYDSTAVTHCGR
jgi:hypothetical protein